MTHASFRLWYVWSTVVGVYINLPDLLVVRIFLFLFLSPSGCKGSKRISEDSSEIAFLLVENYSMTALSGLRIRKEFLEPNYKRQIVCLLTDDDFFSSQSSTP